MKAALEVGAKWIQMAFNICIHGNVHGQVEGNSGMDGCYQEWLLVSDDKNESARHSSSEMESKKSENCTAVLRLCVTVCLYTLMQQLLQYIMLYIFR